MPQPTTPSPSLEQFVRDEVIEALVNEGFTPAQAVKGFAFGSGVTFSELFKSSLNWLRTQRSGSPIPEPRKASSMQTQPASTAKPNGHAAANLLICKCGCGETVPAENRFAYINGHRSKKPSRGAAANAKQKCDCGRPLPHKGRCKARREGAMQVAVRMVDSPAPPVAERVTLAVTEAQLNHFLVRLPLEDKQRLANYYLQTAEESSVA